jgi:ABC-2 type transport system permease protein
MLIKRYRYSVILLRQLVITDFKLRYQGSLLGYMWSLLRPLALFLILYVVFTRFIPLGKGIEHYPIILLLGIVLWTFFSDVTIGSVTAIVSKGDLLRKINFPKYVIVLGVAFSALINLLINLVVVAVFMVINKVDITPLILYLPLFILELFVFSLALAFFLSAAFVRFRDISYIWEVIMQALFYATPILYPLQTIPVGAAKILMLNPIAQIIQDARYVTINQHQTVTLTNLYHTRTVRIVPIAITLFVIIVAAIYFKKSSKNFAENV